jgi:uncharacterized membrane protein YgcG
LQIAYVLCELICVSKIDYVDEREVEEMKRFAFGLLVASLLAGVTALTANAAEVVILECQTAGTSLPNPFGVTACDSTSGVTTCSDLAPGAGCATTLASVLALSGFTLRSSVSSPSTSGIIYTLSNAPIATTMGATGSAGAGSTGTGSAGAGSTGTSSTGTSSTGTSSTGGRKHKGKR